VIEHDPEFKQVNIDAFQALLLEVFGWSVDQLGDRE